RNRPRVVVVEAVDPTGRPAHERWEPALLERGYRLGLFDGLNRFYCREEDAGWDLPILSLPANPFDNWIPAREVNLRTAFELTEAPRDETHEALEREHAGRVQAQQELAAERAEHAEAREELAAELADVREELAAERTALAAALDELAAGRSALAEAR